MPGMNTLRDFKTKQMDRPRLPTAATREPGSGSTPKKGKKSKSSLGDQAAAPYSAAQAAINEMMRKALEEDQYSALGSIVDTDSSGDEEEMSGRVLTVRASGLPRRVGRKAPGPPTSTANTTGIAEVNLDRSLLRNAMRKRLRIEEIRSQGRTVAELEASDAEGDEGGDESSASGVSTAPSAKDDGSVTGSASGGPGKRRKNDDAKGFAEASSSALGGEDDDLMEFGEDEGSIFGSTTGSSNATWVECDKCKKWRRLRGVVDAKKLPSKWYCTMNKGDPDRAKCSAPEEEYETPATPENVADMRTRKHLRLWVRRLQCNEAYESRLPTMTTRGKKRSATTSAKEPYEWVRCCNPSCGKWRALLRFMDASTVMETCKNGEWYCVLNTWDEKAASCAAPQENLPAIGCPPWVMRNDL